MPYRFFTRHGDTQIFADAWGLRAVPCGKGNAWIVLSNVQIEEAIINFAVGYEAWETSQLTMYMPGSADIIGEYILLRGSALY